MRKFLRSLPIRKKKSKEKKGNTEIRGFGARRQVPSHQIPAQYDVTAKLPPKVLEIIFQFLCPHSQDETYETCEQSAIEDACMLCDLRDLAHCALTCRRWRKIAVNIL
jgi:hypothetical protein